MVFVSRGVYIKRPVLSAILQLSVFVTKCFIDYKWPVWFANYNFAAIIFHLCIFSLILPCCRYLNLLVCMPKFALNCHVKEQHTSHFTLIMSVTGFLVHNSTERVLLPRLVIPVILNIVNNWTMFHKYSI